MEFVLVTTVPTGREKGPWPLLRPPLPEHVSLYTFPT